MASNKVQIQVELKGAQQVNKELDSIEKNSVDLSEGFKGVGESFKSVGDVVKAQGGMMGDAFGVLGESVGAITDSVGSFKDSMELAGQTGGKAWLAMLGPIAAVVSGVSLAIEAYREFSGANRAAEDAAENMAAAASDTASRLEAMVEAGVDLSSGALKEFISVNERARLAMEETIKANEKRTVSDQKVKNAIQSVKDAEESLFFTDMRVAMAKKDLELATTEYNKALDEQVAKSKEANKLNKEAFELQELLIKSSKEFLDIYLQERERSDELSLRITNTTNIRGKEKKIIEDTLFKKKQLIDEEIRYKDAIRVLEGQLKKGALSQELFDASTKQLKTNLRDTAKQIKETNDILEPYVKNLEATKEAQDGLKSLGKEAFSKRNAMDIQDLNRELTLMDRNLQNQKDTLTDYGFEFNETIKKNINAIGQQADTLLRTFALIETMKSNEKKTGVKSAYLPNLIESAKQQLIISNQAIEDINKQTLDKLIETEERRVEILLDIRNKEIDEMEVSEKRKKKLREEALADALYTTKRLAEVTKNSLQDQKSLAIQSLSEQANAQRMAGLEEYKSLETLKEEKRLIKREEFVAEMAWRKDLALLAAESNKELLEKEIDHAGKNHIAQKHARETELYNLNQFLNTKKELLEKFNERYTVEQKDQLNKEIKDLKTQIEQKEQANENANRRVFSQIWIQNAKLRDLDLELFIQQKRNVKDFSQIWLDNDQIRANSTIEFYTTQRKKQEEYYSGEMKRFEEQTQRIDNTITSLYQKIGALDPKDTLRTDAILLEIENEQKKIEAIEKLKEESLERQANSSREYNDRMAQYDLEHYQAVGSLIKDFSASSAQAFINAGVAAAFAGESISDAIRTTLRGLAQEATARALYEGAAALGSLAIGDGKGATLHANSAAAFGIAAAAMGALTAAVGVPGGGSSGGGGTTSPTGLSQTSEAPQRESAKTEAMVFNINFGNAVIYDTRAAAERAMAERVMELGTRARRGYNPPRPRI